MPKKSESLIGRTFGRLTVVGAAFKNERPAWVCNCECGASTVASTGNLNRGTTKSCGCLNRESVKTANLKHGHNGLGKRTKEYRAWAHIIGRCHNPSDKAFCNYGQRGIVVCDRWRDSFEAFLADMGNAPAGTSIERINNDGPYAPGNCKWATRSEQSRNTRRTIFVDGMCLKDACAARGISYEAAQMRIRRGQTPEAAVRGLEGKYAG